MDEPPQRLELMEPASPEALLPDYSLWPWLAGGLIAALLALALVFWLLKRAKPAGPGLPAIRKAALADAVAALALVPADNLRDAALLCSLILRKYLSAATGDPALFETHEEFIARHDALQALTPEARAATAEGFSRLATLKYAPVIPSADAQELIAEARALLQTLHHGLAA